MLMPLRVRVKSEFVQRQPIRLLQPETLDRLTWFGISTTTMCMTNPGLNANIRAELARKAMTQKDLADVLKLSQASVSERLVGKVPWRVDELTRLAEVLGVPVVVLLGVPA